MSNNLPTKKLAIKSELLRHLDTAQNMQKRGAISSNGMVAILNMELRWMDKYNIEPDLERWRRIFR